MSNQPLRIYFDGSARSNGDLGVGWITVKPGLGDEENFRSLPRLNKDLKAHSPNYIALMAFAYALKYVPAESDVEVHTNAQSVISWMETESLSEKQKKGVEPVQDAFNHALSQKARMNSVKFIFTKDNTNQRMKRAHELAQTASSPSTPKVKQPS